MSKRSQKKQLKRPLFALVGAAVAAMCLTGRAADDKEPLLVASAAEQLVVPSATPPEAVAAVTTRTLGEAAKALRAGDFAGASLVIAQVSQQSKDPGLQSLAKWSADFQSRRLELAKDRLKQFLKAEGQVQKLLAAGRVDAATDFAVGAYTLAEDKKAFAALPWVAPLIDDAAKLAAAAEKDEKWDKAFRLYQDLESMQPSVSKWKEGKNTAYRRLRLLSMYAPPVLKGLREQELAASLEVEKLLNPTTKPSTRPATESEPDESFKVSWHDILRGVKPDMVWSALSDARKNYWREMDYQTLVAGGLKGVRAVVTTKGLETEFPGLTDGAKRDAFLAVIDQSAAEMKEATAETAQRTARNIVQTALRTANAQTVNLPEEVLYNEFADGAFAECDPFSVCMWPYEVQEFLKGIQGDFIGVGILIGAGDNGYLKVISPLEDSPAYRAGIKSDDEITHIDGKSAKDITATMAIKHITGVRGTPVVLTIRSPDGSSRDYKLLRDKIEVTSVKGYEHKQGGGWNWFVDQETRIAYVRITTFSKNTGPELRDALTEITAGGAKGLILDLRNNGGGLLDTARDVVNRFYNDGLIVSTRANRETESKPMELRANPDIEPLKMPVVVLVNQFSASASEIVSGALKDQKRALVVGERTYGKGSVQVLRPLDTAETSYLKMTTSHYYLPGGKCIHKEENSTEWGVEPDVRIDLTPEQYREANNARTELDKLHYSEASAGGQPGAVKKTTDLLSVDPQLNGALLLLRFQVNGVGL